MLMKQEYGMGKIPRILEVPTRFSIEEYLPLRRLCLGFDSSHYVILG